MSRSPLPDFASIDATQLTALLTQKVAQARAEIDACLAHKEPTIQNTTLVITQTLDTLNQFWSMVCHLHAVVDTPELRQAYNDGLAIITPFYIALSQNKALFELTEQLLPQAAQHSSAMRQTFLNHIRDFRLAGVALESDKQAEYAELSNELTQLSAKFEQNVLDATEAWQFNTEDESVLAGLPSQVVAGAKEEATRRGQTGYTLTLAAPTYIAMMMHADNRALRETFYRAFVTRASSAGESSEWNNDQVMLAILQKRQALAALLGYGNYAEYALQTRMAANSDEVLDFLTQLTDASIEKARMEYMALSAYARELGVNETLAPWDVSYYSEKFRQASFSVSSEDFRPYFPLPVVVKGLFEVVKKLYDLTIELMPTASVWHADAKCYAVRNASGEIIAYFYMDLCVRDKKRSGAWMDECRVRWQRESGDMQLPVAYVICNFPLPVGDAPSLLSHDDVVTLFHEMGHALHHLLTRIDVADVSGINGVAWDAVELPSQLMENWAWEPEALAFISGHYQTGQPVPADMIEKLLASRNFQSAMQMMRQLEFSLFDWCCHMDDSIQSVSAVQDVINKVRERTAVVPVVPYNRFQNTFSHIFAGGYAAGYYSYKWAEVLASDAFAYFKEKGIFNEEAARHFLDTVLSRGGEHPMETLYANFRGQLPSIEALLIQSGIKETS